MGNRAGRQRLAGALHPDRDRAREANDAFEALTNPLLMLTGRGVVRDGEAFIHLRIGRDDRLRLQVMNPEQIDPSLHRELEGDDYIASGIEFDADGDKVAYHVLPDAPGATFPGYGPARRIPATDILHVFDQLYPGQLRGIPWPSPVLLKMRDRDDASDAILSQLKSVQPADRLHYQSGRGRGRLRRSREYNEINVSLEPGAVRILPPGADYKSSNSPAGLNQAVDLLQIMDREIAAELGITYEMLTGVLGDVNYSSARVGLLEFRRRTEMLQVNLIEALRPLWQRWLDLKILSGELTRAEAEDYRAVRFVGPGWPWVDPRNEIEAEVAAITAGLKSREEVIAAQGRDIDDLDDELARDRARQPAENDQ